ncbi:hypothetical protein ACHAAC_05145 [Aeromicrobium sp. CF4.19]|uniref:hypothetical protein n=1 Tax=Aeromicrobium sp. CF4.19 TaxID=3373082 RepID=UPI003EE5E0A5
MGDAFTWGWGKFRENAGPLVIGVLVIAAVALVLSLISNLVIAAIFGSGELAVSDTGQISGGRGFFATLILQLLASALASLVVYVLQAGLVRATLGIADGRKPTTGDVFTFERVGPLFVLAVLLTVGVFIGSLLCYLPGLIFGVLASFSLFFFVDRGSEGIEAIKQSVRFVIDNLGNLILLFLLSIAILIAGALVCGVGLLVAAPVVLLMYTYAFRTLQGQPVAPLA